MPTNTISIIVAIASNNAIGNNNQLIWHIPEDLKRFKALTMGHHIIMGRKTWESIGRPLPGRTSIVVTRDPHYKAEGCTIANSLEQAIELSRDDSEIFVIGGGELYAQALPLASKLYVTHVHREFEGDTFFPAIDYNQWMAVEKQEPAEKDGLGYSFVNYVKG